MAHEKEEKEEKISEVSIKILDDGSFLYTVRSEMTEKQDGITFADSRQYATDGIDKVMDWIADDLGSPHVKKHRDIEDVGFKELVNKIASRPGFKPKREGQTKKEAASAIAASIKDKSMPGWRERER